MLDKIQHWFMIKVSSVQISCSVMSVLCNPMDCSTSGHPVHHRLPEFTQTLILESAMPPNHLILCRPLLLQPSIFPSIRVFSNEWALCIRPKHWSFSFSINPSIEYSGLISFRIDRFDIFDVQGTLKRLLGIIFYLYIIPSCDFSNIAASGQMEASREYVSRETVQSWPIPSVFSLKVKV